MLIVFSGKAQSGKSTSAKLLKQIHDELEYERWEKLTEEEKESEREIKNDIRYSQQSKFQIHSFATELKNIAKNLFGWDGDKNLYYEEKEVVIDGYHKPDGSFDREASIIEKVNSAVKDKGRQLLINIGQQMRWIRETVWAEYVLNKIKEIDKQCSDTIFVVDDLRFKNELDLMKSFHTCYSVRLTRKEGALNLDDISEKDLDNSIFDYYVENDGTPEELKEKLKKLYLNLRNKNES